ncbi:MAG TPA: hypothetical protein DFI01_01570 [Bacteroidales bacterium]|nr:hypothetical protein [Bacteroidales bacterium]
MLTRAHCDESKIYKSLISLESNPSIIQSFNHSIIQSFNHPIINFPLSLNISLIIDFHGINIFHKRRKNELGLL